MSETIEMTRDDVMRQTLSHKERVGELLGMAASALIQRAVKHDTSKFSEAEFPLFAKATPKLKSLTYGSDEYKAALDSIRPALVHHYANNSHHPEHFEDGIEGMTLLDLLEMLVDWKAAGERHADGSMSKSLTHNRERFKIGDQLMRILKNTVVELNL